MLFSTLLNRSSRWERLQRCTLRLIVCFYHRWPSRNGWPSQGYSPVLAPAWKRNSLAISSPRCCALDDDLSTWELETEAFNSCVSTIAGLNPVVAPAWKRNSLAISSPRKRPHVALWMTTCRLESLRPKHLTLALLIKQNFYSISSAFIYSFDVETWHHSIRKMCLSFTSLSKSMSATTQLQLPLILPLQ